MVVIVGHADVSVEQLSHRSTLPSVDALRPPCCPSCDHPARSAGERLGIVGHGTYDRQILGWANRGRRLEIIVRRYLCRGCRRTISVLPNVLYPGRWYAGIVIVVCLFLSLLRRTPDAEICCRFAGSGSAGGGWRTLRRWQRQLLCPLWSWLGDETECEVAHDVEEQARRLRRMLALHGVGPPSALACVESAAAAMLEGTAHDGGRGRLVRLA